MKTGSRKRKRNIQTRRTRYTGASRLKSANKPTKRAPSLSQRGQSVSNPVKRLVLFCGLGLFVLWLAMYGRLDKRVEFISSTTDSNAELVQTIASNYFDQTSRWRLAFDSASFERYLLQEAPFLNQIHVHVSLLSNTVKIKAEPLPDALIWQSDGLQYVVNSSGYVSSVATEAKEELPVVFDEARLKYEPGQKLLPERVVLFIDNLSKLFADEQYAEQNPTLSVRQSSESLVVGFSSYELLLSTSLQPTAQLEAVEDLLAMLQQEGRVRPNEYVDTRVAGRVFWR